MLYFAYGANVNSRNVRRTAPRAQVLSAARLDGYRLVFKRFATLVADAAGSVCGVLYDITPACEHALDLYEDVPRLYRKTTVRIETLGENAGETREAMIYLMNGGEPAPPGLAYFNLIARGYAEWKFDAGVLRRARFATLTPAKQVSR